jgi:hypothetical protein
MDTSVRGRTTSVSLDDETDAAGRNIDIEGTAHDELLFNVEIKVNASPRSPVHPCWNSRAAGGPAGATV